MRGLDRKEEEIDRAPLAVKNSARARGRREVDYASLFRTDAHHHERGHNIKKRQKQMIQNNADIRSDTDTRHRRNVWKEGTRTGGEVQRRGEIGVHMREEKKRVGGWWVARRAEEGRGGTSDTHHE
jgi:hypothetical protein